MVEDCALSYPAVMPPSRVAKSPKTFRRNTQQRPEIREVFERNDRPLAGDEVLDLTQQKVTGLGMATVYRTTKALTDEGWLVPVEVPGCRRAMRCVAKLIIATFTASNAASYSN